MYIELKSEKRKWTIFLSDKKDIELNGGKNKVVFEKGGQAQPISKELIKRNKILNELVCEKKELTTVLNINALLEEESDFNIENLRLEPSNSFNDRRQDVIKIAKENGIKYQKNIKTQDLVELILSQVEV